MYSAGKNSGDLKLIAKRIHRNKTKVLKQDGMKAYYQKMKGV